jgi:hypothetical protein
MKRLSEIAWMERLDRFKGDKLIDTGAMSTLKLFIKIVDLSQPRVDVPVTFHGNAKKGGRKCNFHNQICFGE